MRGDEKEVKKIIGLVILGILIGLIWRIESNRWLSINFVDEQDNFVVGKNLIEGNKVFTNIFSHHQPGTYLLSGAIQKVLKPNTIQSLVRQHRQIITAWSIAWIILLTWRFGWPMMGAGVVVELVKNLYLGNMFLAESLVVFPMIYIVLIFLKNKKLGPVEVFFNGTLMATVGMTLAPMWPILGIIGAGWIWRWKNDIKKTGIIIIGEILVLGLVANFIDIKGYIENAVVINQKYYISIAGGDNLLISLGKATLTPFLFLINGTNRPEIWVIKFFVLGLLGVSIVDLKKKKYGQLLWIWTILTLANLRNFELEKIYYDGFHLLVWVGLIIAIPYFFVKQYRWLWGCLPIIILLMVNKGLIMSRPDYSRDFEIYYSRIFNMSEAIKATKENNDRLLAMPDEVMGYWQSGIKPAGRFIFFYKWMTGVEQLRKEQVANFESGPEYLIIKNNEGLPIDKFLENYQNFGYRGSENSEFYIRNDIYKNFSKEKIDKLKYYGLEEVKTIQTENNHKFVTVVNPIRGRELWKDKSLKPIDDQYKVINNLGLKATWLIQDDVIRDKELVAEIKQFNPNQELGVFLEVSKDLAYKARVYYPTEIEWYSPKAVFLSAYDLNDRKKLIDEMMKNFKSNFGYLPKSAGAWWIDSYSQQYLENKYKIKIFLICADQKTTDKYGIWGQWWGYPYIPSTTNVLVPGNSKSVVIQWAQRDLEKAYFGEGYSVSNYSLQANDYLSQKLDIKYFEKLAGQYLSVEKLGQITMGLETGIESIGNEIEYEKQLKWITDNKITSLKMSEFGDKYREIYYNRNPEKIILGDWIFTPEMRTNKKLGEKTIYQKDLVFKDFYKKDDSEFLNRIYVSENLTKKKVIKLEMIVKIILLIGGFVTAIKFKKIKWWMVLIFVVLVWATIHARYSIVDGQKMVGFLLDNFRFVGINLKTGFINTDLSNVVAKSMLKLKFDELYFVYWGLLGILIGRIVDGRKNSKAGKD